MLLRDCVPRDLPRLVEIDGLCFDPKVAYSKGEMTAALHSHGAVCIVVENRWSEVVAFAIAERGHIITIDVLPRYRKRGLGRKLLLACEERLRASGGKKVRLETAAGNKAAQALYRSLGYTFVRRMPHYYANGEDAWLMEKKLE